jgi:hypothetical protein
MALPSDTDIPSELAAYLARAAPEAHPDIVDLFRDWEANRGKSFRRKVSQEKGGWASWPWSPRRSGR